MNRDALKKAIDHARFEYLEGIAKLITENPAVSLADLRKQHNISHYEMWLAHKMFHVRRKTGRGSKAYRKEQNQ